MNQEEEVKDWAGYTLDELRTRRIITSAKIEISKAMLIEKAKGAYQVRSNPTSLLGRMAGALNYFDYAVIAYRIGRKIYSLFKR